jgi:hypothetical protein
MRNILNFSIREALRGRHQRRCWGLAIPAAVFLTLSLGAPSSYADLSLTLNPFQSTSPTGSFEVDLVNNYATSVTVSDFSIELQLSGLAGVVLTGASTATTAPYIFLNVGAPPPLYSGPSTTDLSVSDSVFTSPYYVTLSSGSTVGLALVTYDTSAASSPGTAFINFGPATNVSDSVNYVSPPLSYTLDYSSNSKAGQIVVEQTAVSVPEPSTLVILATALPCIAGVFSLLARAATRKRSSEAKRQHPQPL